MGGHGGLNILPQKRWNVYNYENREKVRRDEEAAAKEEQLQREQSRKRDAELRLEQLRRARGLSNTSTSTSTAEAIAVAQADEKPASVELKSESDSKHMNLFEGIRIFDPIDEVSEVSRDEKKEKNKRVKKEEVRVVTAEDEKYRLGYGLVGKGVKLPWYMAKPGGDFADQKMVADENHDYGGKLEFGRRKDRNNVGADSEGSKKKKSLEELREERLKREKREKERERALLGEKSRRDGGFSLRR
ncbi:leukocyte receptor cluster member 1 [Coffea eugenioides]|uniref:leukocyte receptor cluster member 1 n=1 Tax=Coffea eugenioides TaxID=49369 RepID=UPI000F60A698|nr:leukocyte receptor cluster member 1 [Coffea eugenioides]